MKFSPLFLGFALIAPGLLAFAPRPSMLTVTYKGKECRVVNYEVEQCVAIVDGKEKSLWRPGGYSLKDAAGFSDNYVDSDGPPLGGAVKIQKLGGPKQTQMPDILMLNATLRARQTLKGGFTVVGLYSPAQFSSPVTSANHPELIIESLPELPAGQAVPVEISLGAAQPPKDPHFFVLFFDNAGREVVSRGSSYAWEYFAQFDRARLAVALKKYLEKFPGADHDPVPAIMPKPVFTHGPAPSSNGLSALLTISASGEVSEVEIQGSPDPETTRCLTAAIEGWLFLPKLKAGQPVPVRVAIPLKF